MQHIKTEQQRDTGGGLLQRNFLDGCDIVPAVNIEKAAYLALPQAGQNIRHTLVHCRFHRRQHRELADFFTQAEGCKLGFGG